MGEAWDLVQQSGIDPWWVNEAFMEEMEQQGKQFVQVLDLSQPGKEEDFLLGIGRWSGCENLAISPCRKGTSFAGLNPELRTAY
jgi:hypothetical protein